jgi:hypothetical protein
MANQSHFQVTPENSGDVAAAAEQAHTEAAETRAEENASLSHGLEDTESSEESQEETSESAPADTESEEASESSESESEESSEEEVSEADAKSMFSEEEYTGFFSEFVEQGGELGDESRSAITERLESAGLPAELLDEFLAGQAARLTQNEAAAYDIVGGQDKYADMIGWAQENLSTQQAEAFDAAVRNPQTAELAIKGLYADYKASGAVAGESLRAQGGASQTGVAPIKSMRELMKLMDSDDYKSDATFRADVERRLAHSQRSGQFRR